MIIVKSFDANISIFILMFFAHILDDFVLQNISHLNLFKQKAWWEENYPQKIYSDDWKMAMLIHCISWTTTIMLPIMIYVDFKINIFFVIMWLINIAFHFFIDNQKCNKLNINLWLDQWTHFMQILITWVILIP